MNDWCCFFDPIHNSNFYLNHVLRENCSQKRIFPSNTDTTIRVLLKIWTNTALKYISLDFSSINNDTISDQKYPRKYAIIQLDVLIIMNTVVIWFNCPISLQSIWSSFIFFKNDNGWANYFKKAAVDLWLFKNTQAITEEKLIKKYQEYKIISSSEQCLENIWIEIKFHAYFKLI